MDDFSFEDTVFMTLVSFEIPKRNKNGWLISVVHDSVAFLLLKKTHLFGISIGLSPLPGFQWQMKVYRDPLLKM